MKEPLCLGRTRVGPDAFAPGRRETSIRAQAGRAQRLERRSAAHRVGNRQAEPPALFRHAFGCRIVGHRRGVECIAAAADRRIRPAAQARRSAEHTSELQSLMRISYAVFCLKTQTPYNNKTRSEYNI